MRWQSARDLKAALELAIGTVVATQRPRRLPQNRLASALVAVATLAAITLGGILVFRRPPEQARGLRFTVPAPATIRSRILARSPGGSLRRGVTSRA